MTSAKVTAFADEHKKFATGAGSSGNNSKELNAWSLAMNTVYDAIVFLLASLFYVLQVGET